MTSPMRAFSLIAILACTACSDDETAPPPDSGPAWQLALSELDGALISLWGSSATDVYAVGGDPGSGPMVVHYDGTRFEKLDSGASGDLWWVHGFAGGPVFMGGSDGLILRLEGGSFTQMTTPSDTGIVFGIWGPSPDDLWAVGGAGQTPSGGFVWRYDGTAWSEEPTAPSDLADTATVFKVWGRSATDVWMVGTGGLTLHHDGTTTDAIPSGTTRTLFTVHGNAEETFAVGGFSTGTILEHTGGAWADVTPAGAPQMTGVSNGAGKTYAAGVFGAVMRRDPGGWIVEDTKLALSDDFHGAFVDPDGGVWAVGGQVAAFPLIRGMLIYKGAATLPTSL
jgi:hypothetical protein